ncbi:MAG TPA: hypothetical protein VMY34_03895 [Acidimicrobiales bacterium]|nr:hypothetical protein [Acidimicrobiales bacterium]
MTVTTDFLERLAIVERRLADHAKDGAASGLTDPDTKTGEQWEAGQVWAHLAEFLPFWIAQARNVLSAWTGPDPIPFGRIKTDTARVAAIESDRTTAVSDLHGRLTDGIATTRDFISSVPDTAWTKVLGVHQALGVMTLTKIVDEFMVGHLEEHADQLDVLTNRD